MVQLNCTESGGKMLKLVQSGDFCPNPDCADYGKPQAAAQRNIIKFGHAHSGQQRYQCRTCRRTFTATKGTLFYRRQTPAREIVKALAQLAEGNRISSVTRTTGHKEDTILAWLREAAAHVSQIEAILMAEYRIPRGQIDGLWAYVGNKGEKRTIPKPKRRGSSGARPCSTWTADSASHAASRKPKPKRLKKSSKR
jgi:transposase-like protein